LAQVKVLLLAYRNASLQASPQDAVNFDPRSRWTFRRTSLKTPQPVDVLNKTNRALLFP